MTNLFDTSANIKALSTIAVENLNSSYFNVQDFGFLRLTSNEKFSQTWYPTPSDIVPAGWFSMDIHNTEFGDFNGDGLMDLIIQPMLFQHVISHQTKIDPILLLQNGQGGFQNSAAIAAASNFPNKHFLYRLGKGDFNGDGITDIALSAMVNVNRNAKSLTSESVPESPEVIFGGITEKFSWTDNFQGLILQNPNPGGSPGYSIGHSMAVGDFNGDGFKDFFSDWWTFYGAKNNQFLSRDINPTPEAATLTGSWSNKWGWPTLNATVSADFNEDGYDDLIYSTMPRQDNGQVNGGDLWLASGGSSGIEDGGKVKSIPRSSLITGNIGTNFISAADLNGDGHQDIIFMEHAWVTDAGDSTNYYSQGRLRLMIGNGKGGFSDLTASLKDPYAGHRHGEGNIHILDLNGDGWLDVVLNGFQITLTDTWGSNSKDYTSVFLNDHGVLNLLNNSDLAYVQSYQFSGEEKLKEFATSGPAKLVPVDIGNDGMVDFVGFVSTPFHSWPQVEQQYTYAYVSKSIKPLGRNLQNESLVGTSGNDKIFGFDGNDLIKGAKGDDNINGGIGIDTAIYDGTSANATIRKISTGYTVVSSAGGNDTLANIERLQFSDKTIAFDIDSTAGQAYRVYQAAFNRTPDNGGLKYWIGLMDGGVSLPTVSSAFIASAEFKALYGVNPTNEVFISKLYDNVLHRAPDIGGYNYWVGLLNTNKIDNISTLINFSESPENQAGVIGVIQNGIELLN